MSHAVQMLGLTVQNFLSAATGIALASALIRGFARREAAGVGNFWADITRVTLYLLLPLCFVHALVLLANGVPQTLAGSAVADTLEGARQTIALGPVASQEAIKMLGTNGGGFFNALVIPALVPLALKEGPSPFASAKPGGAKSWVIRVEVVATRRDYGTRSGRESTVGAQKLICYRAGPRFPAHQGDELQ